MKKESFLKGFYCAVVATTLVFLGYMSLSGDIATAKKIETNLENTLYLNLKDGKVVIRMLPDVAPKHVARIKELVRQGFYDGLTFHRVIDGFMAQGGDPLGNGTGGSGKKIPAEFTSKYSHKRGAVSMARATDPNSADSQFFIVTADATTDFVICGVANSTSIIISNMLKENITPKVFMPGIISNDGCRIFSEFVKENQLEKIT